jgi:hypothetical protein
MKAGQRLSMLGRFILRLRAASACSAGGIPIRLIQQRSLAEVRQLLANGSLPIATMGHALGSNDLAYL